VLVLRGAGEELDEPERRAVTEAEIDDLVRVAGREMTRLCRRS
jgi:hypothetical protein